MNYDSFTDELEKIALDDSTKKWMGIAAGALGGAALLGTAAVLSSKGVRRDVRSVFKGLGKGGWRSNEQAMARKGAPDTIKRQARAVIKELERQGIDPSKARIGVSAIGGSGKSTLAREIAEQAGTKAHDLERTLPKGIFGWKWNKAKLPDKGVLEQTHLLSNIKPRELDKFDAIIKMTPDAKTTAQRIKARGRGGFQTDWLDMGKMQNTISGAFDNTAGHAVNVGEQTFLKVKPQGGFQRASKLQEAVRTKGINPAGMDVQQMSYAAGVGKKPFGPGMFPFVRKKRLVGTLGAAAAGGTGGALLAKKYQDER